MHTVRITLIEPSIQIVCGVDEAGRGPLAGAVYAAAVILNPERPILGLADSKKLSEKKRDLLSIEIKQHALAWAIASSSVEEIDTINILQASLLAMQRAIEQLQIQFKITPDLVQVDGNQRPKTAPRSSDREARHILLHGPPRAVSRTTPRRLLPQGNDSRCR